MICYRTRLFTQVSRHPWMFLICMLICVYFLTTIISPYSWSFKVIKDKNQDDIVSCIADNLDLYIEPPDNFRVDQNGQSDISIAVTFTNRGKSAIAYGKWAIFFNSFPPFRPGILECGMAVFHVNGNLYYIAPKEGLFPGIKSENSLSCQLATGSSVIARTDFLPNWYAVDLDTRLEPRTIISTKGDSLSFVGNFASPNQWKYAPGDRFNPLTPEQRYLVNDIPRSTPSRLVIPTPLFLKTSGKYVAFNPKVWSIVPTNEFEKEATYLAESLKIKVSTNKHTHKENYIHLKQTDQIEVEDEYHLIVNWEQKSVEISARTGAGIFYGIQSLLSLLASDNMSIPVVEIRDKPRFQYRGVMIDVARNFQTKESILKFIDAMSAYKLNKLHLHLSDDEGWRLEIPELPELTEVGAKRCHARRKGECLIPSLGSGPSPTYPGSGFYATEDYRDILKYANDRHVQVIPEIDMPGHARAAILSMEQRAKEKGDKTYALFESEMTAHVQSVQNWLGNAINPCLNSTYRFIGKILDTLIGLHRGIQDLQVFHFGGDEVASGAWDYSPSCQRIFSQRNSYINSDALKKIFVQTVAAIAHKKGLSLAAWEDGMYEEGYGTYRRQDFKNKEMLVIPWANAWERGKGGRAIEFADADYKVILAMSTHLYFDHPQEADPEERGLHWATRYTDTQKTFGFMPDDIFANADINSFGKPYNLTILCNNKPCPKTRRPENILGLQGCLWGETIRSEAHLQHMAFPRIIALSERAWHKALWEDIQDRDERQTQQYHDWKSFAKTLGEKELPRLDKKGISYRVPPPGVVLDGDTIRVNTLYPNHDVEISTDGQTWPILVKGSEPVKLKLSQKNISARALSKILRRPSRVIQVTSTAVGTNNNYSFHMTFISLVCIIGVCYIYMFIMKR